MSSPEPASPPTRRSHAERRRTTQAQLIEATIESLVEDGWSGTTTRSVAQRAGVSQGAQQHYFPTKRALVEAALASILEEQQSLAATWSIPDAAGERAAFVLDKLWEIHCLPVNQAVQELLTVARTDPETADAMSRLVVEAERQAVAAAGIVMAEAAGRPGFAEWVRTSVATMRGLVGVAAVGDPSRSDLWPDARAVLLRGLPRDEKS
ncbi:TetR/AcrR family transcriptional regulator [Nocardioides stalactiti]|uniref:TetR/AcrR family transcriptional regulator n=1 Tax=Nocardioides stalactiti TaxID=2755356 RepID=UPI0016022F48|nr:TetR/AcrR family transcriptional regulator [Nocardioides stalactiti]